METVKSSIKEPKKIFSQTKEQPIECDIVLPDYYPEISKILDCCVSLSREAVTVTADKISVSGRANVRLLYTSAENELKAYETVSKYTRLIPGDRFETTDICIVSQSLSSLNFRAVSPRKAEIRASASVKAEIIRLEEKNVITDIEDSEIEKLAAQSECFSISAFSFASLEISDKLSLPVPKEKISAILRQSVKLDFTEIKAINNKIMLSGFSEICFVYVDSDNKVSSEMNAKIPFTQIKELYGVNENDNCSVLIKNADIEIDIKNSSGGESEASFSVFADAVIIAGQNAEINRIDDVFSVKTQLEVKRSSVFLPDCVKEISENAGFSGEIQCFDNPAAEICDKSVSDISFSSSIQNGEMNVSGSMNVSVLAKNSDGEYCCHSRSCSFEKAFSGALPQNEYFISIAQGGINAEILSDGKISYSGELNIRILSLQGENLDITAGIEEKEKKPVSGDEKIVLYYGEKGEKLWDIAKENNTSLASLRAMNEISSDSLDAARVLVFKS
ncbi:MAG: DUF3794 domain-containing protein [Oscillospiraceae bacterium]|nr:DUF3794 domain-containing protein [Oscillospiraceae bacterium]